MDLKREASKQLHKISDTIRDTLSERSAKNWMQDNYGKVLSVVGALSTLGLIAFFVMRNQETSKFQSPLHHS